MSSLEPGKSLHGRAGSHDLFKINEASRDKKLIFKLKKESRFIFFAKFFFLISLALLSAAVCEGRINTT